MTRIFSYLHIPDNYEGNRYALSWSASGDAVERPDGSTFAFAAEIALFLEGYSLVGPLIHFSYILYLLQRFDARLVEADEPGLTRTGPGRDLVQKADALAIAFREADRPLRNAGALCAWLCREVPPEPDPPDILELCLRLSHGSLMSNLAIQQWADSPISSEREIPALKALDFEMRFLNGLKQLTAPEIETWLRHGRMPLADSGERVAQSVDLLRPKTLEGTLAALVGRERLAGAVPMVASMVAALTLPPRRLAHRALPTGGYADVATRGRPEQILPSQFAIDDLEFLRRFAENELLYFHREEPHAILTEELVLLLDQGVRTWGRVRPALAASALAFGKLAARRKLGLLVGSTGTDGRLIDPLTTDLEALGVFWEASDLTANPSLALEHLLEARSDRPRDVVVLSHPRSVLEPDFAAASRRASSGTRVFSVTIDEPGQVQFREWRRGVPIKVGDFRVDFTPPRAVSPALPNPAGIDPRGWRGDVEPVGFPFRFGVVHRIDRPLFDFDHAGRWLLLSTFRGMLHAWKLDGSRSEVLPRALAGSEVLDQVEAILGVADGFVVGGWIGNAPVAAHYDLNRRVVKAHFLGPALEGPRSWFYSRELHTVVARGRNSDYRALDLYHGEVGLSGDENVSSRAIRAFELVENHSLAPKLTIVEDGSPTPAKGTSVRLDWGTGQVKLSGAWPSWEGFTPMSDGQPTFKGYYLDQAQLRGGVLALVVGDSAQSKLYLFDGPSGVPGREFPPCSTDPGSFILSSDGRQIARRYNERQIEVRDTSGDSPPTLITAKGKTHPDLKLTLGRYGMVVHVGKHINLIRWDKARLEVSSIADGSTREEFELVPWAIDRPASRSTIRPAPLNYDLRRFVSCARAELTAVVDVFGQIALFDLNDRLLAMFVTFRSQVAAWMPDGTRFGQTSGPSPLIDGPVEPDAAERIGQALKAASDAGRSAR